MLPLKDRLIVKRLKPREVTEGGLFIPTQALEKPVYGIVKSVGPKVSDGNIKVQAMICFGKYAGTEIMVGTEIMLILKEDDVYGVVDDETLILQYIEEGV